MFITEAGERRQKSKRRLQSEAFFAELKRCVGFEERDARDLHAMRTIVEPYLPQVAEGVLREMGKFSHLGDQLRAEPERRGRVYTALIAWLRSLFSGDYGGAYIRRRTASGRLHQRTGIQQHYVFLAIEVVRRQFRKIIPATGAERHEAKLESLEKLLALENTLLASSHQDARVEQVRTREHYAMQEHLTQSRHLAEIGRLAASLAHEIKNPLAGISGAIQVIRDSMRPENQHRQILAEVLRQINRLDQTVKDLLVYARPTRPRFDECRIDEVVGRLMTVFAREPAMQRVRFEHRGDERPLPVLEADDNQIEQLLMNLVLNAAHASEDGALVLLHTRTSGKGVRLEVEDRGHGMDEETCRRALAPFYTTKARGTGLGLPICERIVKAHHGTFAIRSETGSGTTVSMYLPRVQPGQTEVEFG